MVNHIESLNNLFLSCNLRRKMGGAEGFYLFHSRSPQQEKHSPLPSHLFFILPDLWEKFFLMGLLALKLEMAEV